MARHASNADRIARAAAEAAATASEKEAKRKERERAKSAPARRSPASPRASALASGRVKVVWAVGKPGLEPVKTFPYREREAADSEAARRGAGFTVTPLKVPME